MPPDDAIRRQDVIDLILRLRSVARADARRLARPGWIVIEELEREAQVSCLESLASIVRTLPSSTLYDSESKRPTLVDWEPDP